MSTEKRSTHREVGARGRRGRGRGRRRGWGQGQGRGRERRRGRGQERRRGLERRRGRGRVGRATVAVVVVDWGSSLLEVPVKKFTDSFIFVILHQNINIDFLVLRTDKLHLKM